MNKMDKYSNEEIIDILNNSISMRDFIKKIGYNSNGSGIYTFVKSKLKKRKIEIPKFEEIYTFNFNKKRNSDEIFIIDSTYPRNHLKNKIIKEKLIEYKCMKCGLINEWNGEKLSLQLEHKNGIDNDNRLDNLCFLCPNCHSQTSTFSGKSLRKIHNCIDCGKEIDRYTLKCKTCNKMTL